MPFILYMIIYYNPDDMGIILRKKRCSHVRNITHFAEFLLNPAHSTIRDFFGFTMYYIGHRCST